MRLLFNMSKSLILILVASTISVTARAQDFDYTPQPEFDFTFQSAKINLRMNPQKVALKGSVSYRLKANISGADTLLLNAPGIKIDSVSSQGKKLIFDKKKGLLQIALSNSSQLGQEYSVKIYYQAAPHFGLLKSSEGTIWTSMLPRATRHWLPVRDNPRVRMKVTLSLRIPDNFKAFASGINRGEYMFPDSTKRITFQTGNAIPITTLAFGVGHFHGINSFAEPNSISIKEQQKLVRKTKQIIQSIKKATGMGYPFQRVTLAILNDDHWETKSYGASTIFLYKNRGNWMTQLRRGLYGQWFGVYLNEAQWAHSWPIRLLQASLQSQVSKSAAYLIPGKYDPKTSFSTVYNRFSVKNWNFWQEYKGWNIPNTKDIVKKIMPALLKDGPATLTPELFNIAWYKTSGQPQINLPAFYPKTSNRSVALNDTVRYRVNFNLNKQTNILHLAFKAEQGSLQQSITLPVVIIADSSNQTRQIDISGRIDSVSITLPAGTQNVRLKVPEHGKLVFELHKPVAYSLYQLHNSAEAKVKVKAATQLGYHTKNPDLQLALLNAMKQNNNPEVQAALLAAYGNITQGANGTQKRFLEALKSNHKQVQLAALEGLQNFKSQTITQQLKKFAIGNTHAKLTGRAMKMFMQRIDSTAALNFANTLVQQDTSGTRAIVAVKALAQDGYTQRAVKYADFYVKPFYIYPVRKRALQILINYGDSTADWNKRINMLLNSLDPRIRYLTVKNIKKIPVNADSVLASHQEYDARVYKEMKKGISKNSK